MVALGAHPVRHPCQGKSDDTGTPLGGKSVRSVATVAAIEGEITRLPQAEVACQFWRLPRYGMVDRTSRLTSLHAADRPLTLRCQPQPDPAALLARRPDSGLNPL